MENILLEKMKAKVKEVDSKEEISKENIEGDIDEREAESEEVQEKEIFDKKGSFHVFDRHFKPNHRCYAGKITISDCATPDRYL